MDYRIREIIKIMKEIDKYSQEQKNTKIDRSVVEEGLKVSANACAQKEFVFPTPYMKNLLVVMGDVHQKKDSDGEWYTEKLKCGQNSEAVIWIDKVVRAALNKYNGPEVDKYDHDLPVTSKKLYDTDCWLGWNIEKFWDIKPGQAKEREERFLDYNNPDTNFSVNQMIRLLETDQAFQKVVLHFLKHWPETAASKNVEEINDPFMSKKSGVSYPYFRNDSTQVPGTDITYGKLCINKVKEAYSKGVNALVALALANNVYTGYPRNQRGKGRALEAQSRITNLVINLVNGNEMKIVQTTPYGIGLVNQDILKENLIKIAEFVLQNPNYMAMNKDFSSWDVTVGYGWVLLQNALRYINTNGSLGKTIVKLRNHCAKHGALLNGPSKRITSMYGRTPSGYIDTTLQNTAVNYLLSNYANYSVDKEYSNNVVYPMNNRHMMCLGDDYLGITLKTKEKEWVDVTKRCGFEAHADFKDAFGVMFVQYRLFQLEGKWVMGYNWPRVLRSMLSKEDQKSLGKCGWTLSAYQQLGKLVEIPESLMIVSSIVKSLDKDGLMLDKPVSEIIRGSNLEDEEKLKTLKGNQLSKSLSTAEKLSNNNPMLPGVKQIGNKVVLDDNYFKYIQDKIKEVVNDNFLIELGFAKPDLNKVH